MKVNLTRRSFFGLATAAAVQPAMPETATAAARVMAPISTIPIAQHIQIRQVQKLLMYGWRYGCGYKTLGSTLPENGSGFRAQFDKLSDEQFEAAFRKAYEFTFNHPPPIHDEHHVPVMSDPPDYVDACADIQTKLRMARVDANWKYGYPHLLHNLNIKSMDEHVLNVIARKRACLEDLRMEGQSTAILADGEEVPRLREGEERAALLVQRGLPAHLPVRLEECGPRVERDPGDQTPDGEEVPQGGPRLLSH